jgi:hypothetical protein
MVISAPRVLATTFDSALIQWDKVQSALGEGNGLALTAGSLQMAMLVLPVGGMSITFSRVAKRLMSSTLRLTQGHPLLRSSMLAAMAGVVAVCGWILMPNGEYRPIQPGERGTLAESFAAIAESPGGRPSLSEAREDELGGAPFSNRSAGGSGEAPLDTTSTSEPAQWDSGTTEPGSTDAGDESGSEEQASEEPEVTTSPTPSPTAEASTTPSPTPSPEESPEPDVTPSPTPTEESE